MASCITSQWGNEFCPQVKLEVNISSKTNDEVTLSWTLYYLTYGGEAISDTRQKSWSVTINGSQQKSGSININGITDRTTTISYGTLDVTRGSSNTTINFSLAFDWNGIQWNGVSSQDANESASGSIVIPPKVITSRTLTLNKGKGVSTFTGAGTYDNGSVATTVATASAGYHLTKYSGTGISGGEWNIPNEPQTHEATWTMNADRTINVYAALNSYTLTINPNGGIWNGTTSNSTITQNYTTTVTIAPPTREGYIFAGWYKTNIGTLNNSFQDPLFINSMPSIYNNNNNGAVTLNKSSDTSGLYFKVIQITTSTNTAFPGYGGYVVHGHSEANQTFIHVIRAKIPKGYKLQRYFNTVGTDYSFTWLTNRDGTGDWKDYAYELTCGSSGKFSTFGFMALEAQGSLPVTWEITGNQITKNPNSNQTFTFGAGDTTLYAQWIPKNFVKIWDGTQWQQAIPYIYNGTEWKQTMPYIYDGEEWKHMER